MIPPPETFKSSAGTNAGFPGVESGENVPLLRPFSEISPLSWRRCLRWNWPYVMALLPWISEYFDDGGFPKNIHSATTEIVLTIVTVALVYALQAQRRRVAKLAITDGLTGLYNSNHFSERFEHETGMARRFRTTLSVIFLDLDNLKSVNDRYGHQVGSALLSEFGGFLARHVRDQVDLCFRFGGDEFIVVCPRADLSEAREIAGRIVESARLSPLKEKGATVSAGVAEFNPGESAGQLLSRADRGLYEAKIRGKNRVEVGF